MYNLRMKGGDLVIIHMNTFAMLSRLLSIDVKISDEDKCIGLLCFYRNHGSLVVSIGSNETTLRFDETISSFLSKKTRQKSMEDYYTNALFVRGYSLNKNKNKYCNGRYKSRGISKSLEISIKIC